MCTAVKVAVCLRLSCLQSNISCPINKQNVVDRCSQTKIDTTGVTFAGFGTKCGSRRDYVISTSPGNEDGQHPVQISEVTLDNVDTESKLFFHRPNVRWVFNYNPIKSI